MSTDSAPSTGSPNSNVIDPSQIDALLAGVANLTTMVSAVTQAGASGGNRLRDNVPTLSAYLPRAMETLGTGTARTYRSPLRRLCEFVPCLPIDPSAPDPTVGAGTECGRLGCTPTHHVPLGQVALDVIVRSDLERFAAHVQFAHRREELDRLRAERLKSARAQGHQVEESDVVLSDSDLAPDVGRSGREGAVTAMRWLFATATGDLLVRSPAADVPKPKRAKTVKRAFSESELEQVVSVALATATDPALIWHLIGLSYIGGARQGEGLSAGLSRIDVDRQTIALIGKDGAIREQPFPMSFIVSLMQFALDRGAHEADDRVLRNLDGKPISRKTHSTLWDDVRAALPFAARMNAATHCLRKTGATAVERHTSTAISDEWLRHTAPTLNGVYTGASLAEVATAVADLTGEPHPLATRVPRPAATSLLLPALPG